MAKKKRKNSRKKVAKTTPEHILPVGFWSQILAILLIASAILMIVAWFNAGGPVLDWLYISLMFLVGYTVYILPALFILLAVQIFRAEDNKLHILVKLSAGLAILWITALLGLPGGGEVGSNSGGVIGDLINKGVLQLVDGGIAAFIYILLIFITALFMFSVNPLDVIKKIYHLIRRDTTEEDRNQEIIREAEGLSGIRKGGFKLTKGVPIVEHSEDTIPDKKTNRPTGLHNSDNSSQEALVTITDPDWQSPSFDLLEKRELAADPGNIEKTAAVIQETLKEFDVDVDVNGANVGPKVTQFTLKPASGVKLARITALESNLALNLEASSLRIEAPIPGKGLVGVEVPNKRSADVRIRSIISTPDWRNNDDKLAFAVGKDISGEAVIGQLGKMPHLLIAGQTGSGKSVMINTLLMSLLYRNSPSDLKLILVDPKQVEMTQYEGIPHLLTGVITDVEKTVSALKWSVNEMERRYKLLKEAKSKDIRTYNQNIRSNIKKNEDGSLDNDQSTCSMPYIVIVIDELADFMMAASRDMEALIARLAQKARAVGIHLVLATQTPRADIITGKIKANIPARIAFTVASQLESRIILDQGGAEKLLGMGDMLYVTASMPKPIRVQGALVTDNEIGKIADYLCAQSEPQYNEDVVNQRVSLGGRGGSVGDFDSGGSDDPFFLEAVQTVIDNGKASASYLQRRFKLGYNRASRIIDSMEEKGIVSPANGQKPREVLISSIDEIDGLDNDQDQYDETEDILE